MNHCKDCAYWRDWEKLTKNKEHTIDDYKTCMHPNMSHSSKNALVALDSFALHARGSRFPYLITGPDFGCVHHKEKDEK